MSYKTVCSGCGKPIELLKDPEGKVYHGDCFDKAGKKVGGRVKGSNLLQLYINVDKLKDCIKDSKL